MRHTISCLVRNRFGVLAHVAGLFSSRGYNIESLTVSKTEDPMFSRMTIVTVGDDSVIEQIRKQLGKLIDIIKVIDLSDVETVERDLLLIKVNAQPGTRGEIIQLTEAYGGRVVDIGQKELLAELTGSEKKVDSFVRLMQPFGIKEIARTGRVSMARGSTTA